MNQILKYGSISAIPLYNCSELTPEQWSERDGVRRPIAGSLDFLYGVLINILYVPILGVMFEKEQFRLSCFKIMIFLGIVDMLALGVNSIITGFLAIQGSVYCTHPNLIYCAGMAGLGLWCCSCIIALTLVVNRILDLTKPHLVQVFFGGYRTFVILTVPVIYGLYFVYFTAPIAFSSKYMTWFFDPMIFENMGDSYANIPHGFNNIFVVAVTCVMYAFLCYILGQKFKHTRTSKSKSQKLSAQIFIQSSIICAINQIASIIYVIMNFIEVPVWLTMLGHVLWQCGHGAPVVVYLVLNRTVRNGLLNKLGIQQKPRPLLAGQFAPASGISKDTSRNNF